ETNDMRYQLAPLFCRPWTLNGITPRLIESHYENNYGGALNRLSAITEELGSLDPSTTPADVLSRLSATRPPRSIPRSCMSCTSPAWAATGVRYRTRWQTRSSAISVRSTDGARSSW